MHSNFFTADHDAYREMVREFVRREVTPKLDKWDADRLIDRDVWRAAARQGVTGLAVPEELGGSGVTDFRFRIVVTEELMRAGATSLANSFGTQDDIVLPYLVDLGTTEQRRRWIPPMADGELIGAIAMSEPNAGSDLQGVRTTAVKDGDEWVINGQKTFITSGINAGIVIVFARTDSTAGSRGFSLILVEEDTPGFVRGRKLNKVGLHAQDTAELYFDNVRVPADNLLGVEGRGLTHLMERLPRERMSIAISALASIDAIFSETVRYCFERNAFRQAIGDFQNSRFVLAEIATEVDVTRSYLEQCTRSLNAGTLNDVDAAKAKWWASELQKRAIDRCLQLYGGYGYMLEYPVARAFIDSRIQTIYGGTTEIMKEIIGRDLAASARGGAQSR